MKVYVKDFKLGMEIKNRGIEIEIRNPADDQQLGDLVLTKTGVIWCPGRTTRANGHTLDWNRFIALIVREAPV